MSSSIVAVYGVDPAGDLRTECEIVAPEHIKVTLVRHFLSGAKSAIVGYNGNVYLCTKAGRGSYDRTQIDETHEHYILGALFQDVEPQQKRQYRTGRGQPQTSEELPNVIQSQLI